MDHHQQLIARGKSIYWYTDLKQFIFVLLQGGHMARRKCIYVSETERVNVFGKWGGGARGRGHALQPEG